MSSQKVVNQPLGSFPVEIRTFPGYGDVQVVSALDLVTIVDTTSTPTEYYGCAIPGSLTSAAVWQIQRRTVSGTVETFDWAEGDSAYTNIWDDRASLTYG